MIMEKIKLGILTKIRTGKLDANASSEDGQYPFFTCSREPLKISSYSYDCECVLVAGNGDLNVKYYNGKFDAYQRTYIIEDNSNGRLFVPYLYYFLEGYIDELRQQSIGGVIKYIKLGNLTDALIPLPEFNKQIEIVNILDKAKKMLDNRNFQLLNLDELIKSRFVEMFGDPILNDKKWPLVTVIDECDCMVPGRDKPKSFTGDIPWITIDDLIVNGITLTSNKGFGLTKDEITSVKRKTVPKESVLMSCVGNLGICSIAGTDLIINQQLHSFQCRENISNYYLMHYLGYRTDYMNKHASSTTVLYMNKSVCNSIPLMLPPLELQKQFSGSVQHIDKLKLEVKKSLEETKILFDSLMRVYFE